jgi:hypothetical protein
VLRILCKSGVFSYWLVGFVWQASMIEFAFSFPFLKIALTLTCC